MLQGIETDRRVFTVHKLSDQMEQGRRREITRDGMTLPHPEGPDRSRSEDCYDTPPLFHLSPGRGQTLPEIREAFEGIGKTSSSERWR